MQLSLTVSLAAAAIDLGQLDPDRETAAQRLTTAIAYLMGERDPDRPGVAYPDFRRSKEPADCRELELTVDAELWGRFHDEAERQGVSSDRLLEHALLHLATDEDSGAFAARLERG